MNRAHPSVPALLKGAAAVIALAATSGVAFAAWMEHTPGIFMALVETGMAWCF